MQSEMQTCRQYVGDKQKVEHLRRCVGQGKPGWGHEYAATITFFMTAVVGIRLIKKKCRSFTNLQT
jgi:hypothetical protein